MQLSGSLRVSQAEEDCEAVASLADEALDGALRELNAMRFREGAALADDLSVYLTQAEAIAASIAARAPKVPETYRERIRARLAEWALQGVDEQRVAQEVAILADKCAVDEELARLNSHFAQMRSCMSDGAEVGRRMDFLIQEMNREVNTIGSKAADAEIAQHVVALKCILEKLRETGAEHCVRGFYVAAHQHRLWQHDRRRTYRRRGQPGQRASQTAGAGSARRTARRGRHAGQANARRGHHRQRSRCALRNPARDGGRPRRRTRNVSRKWKKRRYSMGVIVKRKGMLLIISGPSGTGKGTLVKKLMECDPSISFSCSVTTRAPRVGEIEGVHYHFIDDAAYDRMLEEDAFLEHATVHGPPLRNPRAVRWIATLPAARMCCWTLTRRGALSVMSRVTDYVSVFILPPSFSALRVRLHTRNHRRPRRD